MTQSIAHSKRKRRNANRTPAEREIAKQKFLVEYSRTKSIIHSCAYAGMSQTTYYQWVQQGYITQDDLSQALEGYHDNIRKKVSELALEGAKRQVRDSHGNPLFGASGNPEFEYVVSEKILLRLYEHLPENRNQQNGVTPFFVPVQGLSLNEGDGLYIIFHTHLLNLTDIADLKRIAKHHEANKDRAKANGWVEQSGESPYPYLHQEIVEGSLTTTGSLAAAGQELTADTSAVG